MRRWTWKRTLILCAIALGVYLVIGIVLAGRDLPPIPPVTEGITLKGGHVLGNRITTRSWTFDYQRAQLSPDGTIGSVDGVRHGIIFKNGKPYMTISAEHVSLNIQTLDFTAVGKVHVERVGDANHIAYETDLVEWQNAAKLLQMPHPSYIMSGAQRLAISQITIDFGKGTVHTGKIEGSVEVRK